jgi:hypothetical protein
MKQTVTGGFNQNPEGLDSIRAVGVDAKNRRKTK